MPIFGSTTPTPTPPAPAPKPTPAPAPAPASAPALAPAPTPRYKANQDRWPLGRIFLNAVLQVALENA